MYKTYLGIGGYGYALDPNMWTPWGTPVPGDNLQITSGIPFLGDQTFGLDTNPTQINLVGSVNDPNPPALLVWNETFKGTTLSNETGTTGDYTARVGQVVLVGKVTLDQHSGISASSSYPIRGTAMYVWDYNNSQLINQGSLSASPLATLNIDAGTNSFLVNDGNITANGGTIRINSDVIGTGNIWSSVAFQQSGVVDLAQSVSSGQILHLDRGGIELEKPTQFTGIVDLAPYKGNLMLDGIQAASWSDIANSSLVEIFNQSGTPIDVINIIPQAQGSLNMTTSYTTSRGWVTTLNETPLAAGQTSPTHGIVSQT